MKRPVIIWTLGLALLGGLVGSIRSWFEWPPILFGAVGGAVVGLCIGFLLRKTRQGTTAGKKLLLILTAMSVSGMTLCGLRTWHQAKWSAGMSCAASIGESIFRERLINPEGIGPEWKIFSIDESDRLIRIGRERGVMGDCHSREPDGLPTDPYGEHFQIAVRRWPDAKPDDYSLEIRVWSAGWDGSAGTSDDIMIPYGQSIPK